MCVRPCLRTCVRAWVCVCVGLHFLKVFVSITVLPFPKDNTSFCPFSADVKHSTSCPSSLSLSNVCLSKRLSSMRRKILIFQQTPSHSTLRATSYLPSKISAGIRSNPVVIVAAGTLAETTENFERGSVCLETILRFLSRRYLQRLANSVAAAQENNPSTVDGWNQPPPDIAA